jgi:hypothetical protein
MQQEGKMAVKNFMLSVGFDKNGEAEFDVHLGNVMALSFEEMQRLRAMIPVAITQLERAWTEYGPPSKEMASAAAR